MVERLGEKLRKDKRKRNKKRNEKKEMRNIIILYKKLKNSPLDVYYKNNICECNHI